MSEWKMDGKPALVVLHVQNSFFKGGPESPVVKAIKGSGMVDRIQVLLKAFRDKNLPVFFAGVIGNPIGTANGYGKMFKNTVEAGKSPGTWDIYNSSTERAALEPIPELGRRPEEPLVTNWRLSAFNVSGLDLLLKSQGVKTLVLTGFAGNMVVYNTALQAIDLNYSVIISRDGTATIPGMEKAFEAVMDIMAPMISLVTTSDDVIAHL